MKRCVPIALSLALLALLPACSIFSRPDNQFYELASVPGEPVTLRVGERPYAIGALSVPPQLERRGIVIGRDGGKLEVRGTQQWAAPFEEMVLRTIAFNLADRLPEGSMVLPGQLQPAGGSRPIQIVIESFAAGPSSVVVLNGRWSEGAITSEERIEIPLESLETSEVVEGMNEALAALADRIVAGLAR